MAWDSKGARLATGFGNGQTNSLVHIWNADTGALLNTLDVSADYIQGLAWHPTEGNTIAVGQNTTEPMEFWDASTGEKREEHDFRTWVRDAMGWSPDGKLLGLAGWRPQVVDWNQRKLIQSLNEPHTGSALGVSFSSDGSQMASSGQDGMICVYETETWELQHQLSGHAGPALRVVWHPLGSRLASVGADGTLKLWDVVNERVVFSRRVQKAGKLQWSRDGRYLAYSEGKRVRLMDMSVK